MVNISDKLLILYSAQVEASDDTSTIDIPKRKINQGEIAPNDTYRVAILPAATKSSDASETATAASEPETDSPPVAEGEIVEVEIETLGDQGYGIARVRPEYVIIVPETNVGDRVSVRIEEAKRNVVFAQVVDRHSMGR